MLCNILRFCFSVRKKRRMLVQKESIFNQEPNDYEQKLIHNLFSTTIELNNRTFNTRHLPADAVWMENAIMLNNVFSHPEDRNAHNTVFGGFLMRHALEISWALGYQFTYVRQRNSRSYADYLKTFHFQYTSAEIGAYFGHQFQSTRSSFVDH